MKNLLLIVLAIYMTGCANTAPLAPVVYGKPATVTSGQTATIELYTGVVTGDTASTLFPVGNNFFVPVATGPATSVHFAEGDQLRFLESLSSELNRMKVLHVLEFGRDISMASDQVLRVIFLRTHHDPDFQVYTLDVALQIEGGDNVFVNQYHIVSHTSLKEKLFSNASQGKEKAATKLLEKVVDDIQLYLAQSAAGNEYSKASHHPAAN